MGKSYLQTGSRAGLSAGLVVLTVSLLAGCNSRPSAPELRDQPTYENDQEGFRFQAPEGWNVSGSTSAAPAKDREKQRILVQYKYKGADSEKAAAMEVTMADLPETTDLLAKLGQPSHGVRDWKRAYKPVTLEIDGVKATRVAFTGHMVGQDSTKEITFIRRGERVYFFAGYFGTTDTKSRDQIRRAVGSLTWKK